MRAVMVLYGTRQMLMKDIRVMKESTALLDAGFDVTVMVYGTHDEVFIENSNLRVEQVSTKCLIPDSQNLYRLPIKAKKTFLVRILKRIVDLFLRRRTMKRILQLQPDILHCHDYQTLHYAKVKDGLPRVSVIYDSHELMSAYVYKPTLIGHLRRANVVAHERKYLQYVDRLITVCDYETDFFADKYQYVKTTMVRNVAKRYIVDRSDNSLRERVGATNGERLVIYQGGLVSGKSIDVILEAIEKLDTGIFILFAGHGNMETAICGMAEAKNNVFFLGDLSHDQLYTYIAQCDLGLCLIQNINDSYYYSLPNKLWDYIVNGVPCIASDFPMMRNVINDSGAGVLIDPTSSDILAQTINTLCLPSHEAEMRRLKEKANAYGQRVNWGTEQAILVELYKALMDGHGA